MSVADWQMRGYRYPEPHNAYMPSHFTQPLTQAELLAAAKRLRAMLKMPDTLPDTLPNHRWLKERDE